MSAFSPDRELLNVQFEGYKLSDDPLTQIHAKLTDPVRVAKLKEDEFSYQYVRAYTLHNHLHHDPSDPRSVYWCSNKGYVIKATIAGDSISTERVFSFSKSEAARQANFSMSFVSTEMGIACAGDDTVILFKREMSANAVEGTVSETPEQWSIQTTVTVGDSGRPVVVITAAPGEMCKHVDILCAELLFDTEASAAADEAGMALISYKWVRIYLGESSVNEEGGGKFESKTIWEVHSKSHTLYAAFQQEATSKMPQLLFMSETEPKTTYPLEPDTSSINGPHSKSDKNNGTELDRCEDEEEEEPDRHHGLGFKEDENEGKTYTWDQSEEDVVISFQLAEDVAKGDVCVTIEPPEVVVGLTDGSSLLRGQLTHAIDLDGTTWTMEKNVLEVTLAKKVEGVNWKYLFKEKNSGEAASKPFSEGLEELTEDEKQKAKELLRNLYGEDSMPSEKRPCPNTVQGMLEECDSSEEDPLLFVVTEQGRLEAKVDIGGHQMLFVAPGPGGPGQPDLFSLRHDVDATVWIPHSPALSSTNRWVHRSTFNALGYVQASKREKKFTTCSPDLTYAVICDCTRHVFVYFQPERSSKTAVEYVHTFLEPGTILGVVASDGNIVFVLTDRELCVLKIPAH